MSQRPSIPHFNTEFDLGLLLYIARRNVFWFTGLILICLLGGFLYLRYTYPVYQSGTTIKLGMVDNAKNILNLQNPIDGSKHNRSNELASAVEVMRSPIIIRRALEDLPLRVSYYKQGTVLEDELYKRCTFSVESQLQDSSLLGLPIYITFADKGYCSLYLDKSLEQPLKEYIPINKWVATSKGSIKINVADIKNTLEQINTIKGEVYYFKINNIDQLADYYSSKININLQNEEAQTIYIQVTENNAQKVADLANSMANQFIVYNSELRSESANRTLSFINDQLKTVEEELKTSESILESYQRQNRYIEPTTGQMNMLQKSTDLENQRLKLNYDKTILEKLQSPDIENKELAELVLSLGSDFSAPNVLATATTIQKLQAEKDQLLRQVTAKSEIIRNINDNIESRRKVLLSNIQLGLKAIEEKKSSITQALLQIDREMAVIPSKEAGLRRVQRIFNINEKFYNSFLEKKAEFLIIKAGLVPDDIILEYASAPSGPLKPIRTQTYAFSFVIGFMLGLALILLQYVLHNEITSIDDIKKYTEASVLGVVPNYREIMPVSKLIVDRNPKSLISEAFRTLRTNLTFISNEPGAKTIAVTSTISGEGKTFVAINLAGVLAYSGKKVIIIDLDMRKPKIHEGFQVDNTKGMSTILIGNHTPEECTHYSQMENLNFITAGPNPPNPAELIMNDRMNDFVWNLKKKYDVIIFDTPPIGLVTDGVPIIRRVDYPIYILRANYSRKNFIQNVNTLMDENGIKHLSMVLNNFSSQGKNFGYGTRFNNSYGYGYGYGYGYYEEKQLTRWQSIQERFKELFTSRKA